MRRIGVSGHRTLTEPTRRSVARELAARLAEHDDVEGWTSLAEGADSIFAWAVLAAGGEIVFVRPSEDVEADFTGRALAHFRAARAVAVRTVPLDFPERSEDAYLAAGKRIVDEVDEMYLIWNEEPAVSKGGTGDIAAYCVRQGKPYRVIWPPGSARP